MRSISIHVSDRAYQEFKAIAAREERPVAELIRQAMTEYLSRERRGGRSILEIAPHESGALAGSWTRDEILDEMIEP
jgi:hypothetical protein